MNEHTREDAKTQESTPENRDTGIRDKWQDAYSRGADYLRAGVQLMDVPPEALLKMATRIGNSNMLELLSSSWQDNPETVSEFPDPSLPDPSAPDPSAPDTNKEANRITTSPLFMVETPLSLGMGTAQKPFPVNRLRIRAETDTRLQMQEIAGVSQTNLEGVANGASSD